MGPSLNQRCRAERYTMDGWSVNLFQLEAETSETSCTPTQSSKGHSRTSTFSLLGLQNLVVSHNTAVDHCPFLEEQKQLTAESKMHHLRQLLLHRPGRVAMDQIPPLIARAYCGR